MHILIATHNAGKIRDIENLFGEMGWTFTSSADHHLPSPPETEDTLEGNARIKARAAVETTGLTVMTDDSGFFVDALGGAPGVFGADWAETPNGRDYEMARRKVWDAIQEVAPGIARPTAQFVTTWLILTPEGDEHIFHGEVRGHLVWPPRGDLGHDYDSMFVPDGADLTFGEMTPAEKNVFSSRRHAFSALRTWWDSERSTNSAPGLEDLG